MKIVYSSEMNEIDRRTIQDTGIASCVLMENAGRAISSFLLCRFKGRFVIIAGTGNNGGDGLVVARNLVNYGREVVIFILANSRDNLSSDLLLNLQIAERLGQNVVFINEANVFELESVIRKDDVILDAILGVGFTPPLSGLKLKVIEYLAKLNNDIVSVDIPSGIYADSGQSQQVSVRATYTLAIGYPKYCHILYPACQQSGEVFVVEIGLDAAYDSGIQCFVISPQELSLPKIEMDTHKYRNGSVAIVGGSIGMSGAVVMAAKSAMSAGAGMVTCVIPESINNIVSTNLLQEMTLPVKDFDGKFCPESIEYILSFLNTHNLSSIVLGPGMRVSEVNVILVEQILTINKPLVLDADGLNNLVKISDWQDKISKRNSPTILTPHYGEASRLLKVNAEEIATCPHEFALSLARTTKAYIVLKGARTVIATPAGAVYYLLYGNPGMAKAGSGDILSGILGALVNNVDIIATLQLGCFVHSRAADLAVKYIGGEKLFAQDIIDYLALVYNEVAAGYLSQDKQVRPILIAR